MVALSPSLALHSGLARPYSLLPLICLASVYTLWCGLCHGRAWNWIAHALATLAMLLTHNWAWLVFGGEWLVAGAWFVVIRRGPGLRPVRGWLLTQAAIMAGYAPWLPTLVYQSCHAGHGPRPVPLLLTLQSFATATTSLPLLMAVILALVLIGTAIWANRATGPATAADKVRGLAIRLFLLVPVYAFVAATLLSPRNFLLEVRCLQTIAPCLLLAIAHGIASAPATPRAVFTGVLTVSYLSVSIALFGHVKSNAREVARAVAAAARPMDLILVEPCFLASSFIYYYAKDSERIALFPAAEQAGAVFFNDVEDRLRDPEAMKRLRARLARAHWEGRRVWLVTDRDSLSVDDVPDSDELPPMQRSQSLRIRYNQIRKQLNALYGAPNAHAIPVDNREDWEILSVFLYGKDDRGSDSGSIATPRHSSTAATSGATLANQ